MQPRVLVLAAGLALAVTVPAAAQSGIQASFDAAPERPVVGETVRFTATTDTAGVTVQHTWDLDDDGAFDDATGDVAQTSFATAGDHVVRLRATTSLGAPSEAAKTIVVRPSETPEPSPTPTPEPSPTAAPTPAPSPPAQPTAVPNRAPVAVLDRECRRHGELRLCGGPLAFQNSVKRLKAAGSGDPDGSIVRYDWDLDGDGQFETATQTTPFVDHEFEPRFPAPGRTWRVAVRVTDDDGATAIDGFDLTVRPAACQASIPVGRWTVRGTCLRPSKATQDGEPVTRWLSEGGGVTVNGLSIQPMQGRAVRVDVPRAGSRAKPEIGATRAVVSMGAAGGATVRLAAGKPVLLHPDGNRLRDVALSEGAQVGGLAITALLGDGVTLSDGAATARARVALPGEFGGATSKDGVRLGGAGATVAAGKPLSFEVPSAALGPIGMRELKVSYDGEDLWEIKAGVSLPAPVQADIDGSAGIYDTGAFEHAGAEVRFKNGVPLAGSAYLTRIAFRVEVRPKKSRCVPKQGLVAVPWDLPFPRPTGLPSHVDYGKPTFALCGGVGLSAGPPIGGKRAVGLDADLGWATYADRPWVLWAMGKLSIVEIPVASAELQVHGDGYVKVNGDMRYGIDGVATLDGRLRFEMLGAKFNALAAVEACLEFADLCAGAKALVSSRGIAACLDIDVLVTDWEPGFGYLWGRTPDFYFDGCDVGPYKVRIQRSRAHAIEAHDAPRGVTVRDGLPGTVLVLEGRDAPPKVTLTGPDGRKIASGGGSSTQQQGSLIVEDPRTRRTHVLVERPAGGTWAVDANAGSSPIVKVEAADGLPKPEVSAKVTGSGHERALQYAVTPVTGQTVRFIERGETAGGSIGTAKAAKGGLRFRPADGAAEKRSIVALVEQHGKLRDEIEVAAYDAPKAAKPGTARRITTMRRGKRLVARWTRVRGAASYAVAVRLADGRTIVRSTRSRRLAVAGVTARTRGRIAVRAISGGGMTGGERTVRLKPRRR